MVTHAISATYSRYDRMSPTAAALAVLLHVLTALALWWVSPLNRHDTIEQEPIEVTVEPPPPPQPQPAPQPPPAPPTPQVAKPPPPQAAKPLGLAPEAPKTEPPKPAEKPAEAQPEPPTPQQAVAPPEPKPEPKPEPPPIEKSLPPLEAPPPPLTSRDIPRPAPPPTPAPPKPAPQPHPVTPPPPQQQAPKPSPLQTSPMKKAPAETQDQGTTTTFINPAAEGARTRATENYLNQAARHIAQNSFRPRDTNLTTRRGVIGISMIVARDGRLIGVSIAQSSGAPGFDADMMGFIRSIAPFPPLPADLGNQTSITLRIPYNFNPD